jgi:hypothetical protein
MHFHKTEQNLQTIRANNFLEATIKFYINLNTVKKELKLNIKIECIQRIILLVQLEDLAIVDELSQGKCNRVFWDLLISGSYHFHCF